MQREGKWHWCNVGKQGRRHGGETVSEVRRNGERKAQADIRGRKDCRWDRRCGARTVDVAEEVVPLVPAHLSTCLLHTSVFFRHVSIVFPTPLHPYHPSFQGSLIYQSLIAQPVAPPTSSGTSLSAWHRTRRPKVRYAFRCLWRRPASCSSQT